MKNTAVTFKIEGLPCNVNNAVRMTSRGGYKTKQYRDWVKRAKQQPDQKIKFSEWYEFDLELYFPVHNKSHKKPVRKNFKKLVDYYEAIVARVKRKDTSNYLKYAEDIIFSKLGTYEGVKIDDKQIIQGSYKKIDSEEQYCIITVYCV